jgi:hypothetical protein
MRCHALAAAALFTIMTGSAAGTSLEIGQPAPEFTATASRHS